MEGGELSGALRRLESDSVNPRRDRTISKLHEICRLWAVDIAAAGCTGMCIAPAVAIVDRAVVESTAGVKGLFQGIRDGMKQAFLTPHNFLRGRPFRIVLGVYTCTYLVANSTESLCSVLGYAPDLPKLVGTTAANLTLCVRKDIIFARLFGAVNARNRAIFPIWSSCLFVVRDCLTIAASFTIPPRVVAWLRHTTDSSETHNAADSKNLNEKSTFGKTHLSSTTKREDVPSPLTASFMRLRSRCRENQTDAEIVAQLTAPLAIQFASTPLHLLALDLYNRPHVQPSYRVGLIMSKYVPTLGARLLRILPAFGVGGLVNINVRRYLHEQNFLG